MATVSPWGNKDARCMATLLGAPPRYIPEGNESQSVSPMHKTFGDCPWSGVFDVMIDVCFEEDNMKVRGTNAAASEIQDVLVATATCAVMALQRMMIC